MTDPTEAALRKWCPRRVRNDTVAPVPVPLIEEQPRVGITEEDLLRGYGPPILPPIDLPIQG